MLNVFKPPVFDSIEKTHKAEIFHSLLLFIALLVNMAFIIMPFVTNVERIPVFTIYFILSNILFVTLFFLNRKGLTNLAVYIYLLFFIVLELIHIWNSGGTKSNAFHHILGLLIISGLLLGWVRTIWVGLILIISTGFILISEYYGIYMPPPHTPHLLSIWVGNVLTIFFIVFIQFFSDKLLKRAFRKQNEEIELRRKTEKSLLVSETKYQSIFDNANDAIFILDGSTFIDCNSKTSEIFGCNKYDIIGKTVVDFSPTFQNNNIESSVLAQEYISKVLSGIPYRFEWKHIRLDQTPFDAEVSLNSIEIDEKKYLLAIVRDISEQKWIEQELIQSKHKLEEKNRMFEKVIETIPVRLFWKDRDSNYLGCNTLFAKDAGLETPKDIVGKTDLILWHKVAELYRNDDFEVINTGIPKIAFEEPQEYDNGSKIWLRTSKVPLKDSEDKIIGVLGTYEDITDKKTTQIELENYKNNLEKMVQERSDELSTAIEELQAINEEFEATNDELFEQKNQLQKTLSELSETQNKLFLNEKMASLGILTSGIAHEINNPINYIYNGVEVVKNYISENSPEHIENLNVYFEAINTGINRTTEIVKSLGKYSRSDNSPLPKVNVNQVLDDCLLMTYNQYKNNIDIEREFSDEIPMFEGHEGKLHQVFLNIIVNAIHAIEQRGVIKIRTFVENQNMIVEISDTGSGIKPENMKHIFDPFFTTKDPGKGTGLGLSISQKIVSEHKGNIICNSQLGIGSKFSIILPI